MPLSSGDGKRHDRPRTGDATRERMKRKLTEIIFVLANRAKTTRGLTSIESRDSALSGERSTPAASPSHHRPNTRATTRVSSDPTATPVRHAQPHLRNAACRGTPRTGRAQAFKLSLSSLSLSSSSHTSSSVNVPFFFPSLIFFSMSLMFFFLSLSLKVVLFFTSILLPAPS